MPPDQPPTSPSGDGPESGANCEPVRLEQLRKVPLFDRLSPSAAELLCSLLAAKDFKPGTRLFNTGDVGDAMYIIEHGSVRITLTDADGQAVILAELRDGDFFGEMALVDGHPRSANATVVEETRMVVLTRENFLSFIQSDHQIMLAMLVAMATRLRRTDNLLRHRVSRNANAEEDAHTTGADRAADLIARFGGSWKFIATFSFLLTCWVLVNTLVFLNHGFDPYPFLLLSTALNMLAAFQAPIIMMSQNRQSRKDRLRADLDYEVNLKNEVLLTEIRTMLYDQQRRDREDALSRS